MNKYFPSLPYLLVLAIVALLALPLVNVGIDSPVYADVNGSTFASLGQVIGFPELDGSVDSLYTSDTIEIKGRWGKYTQDFYLVSIADTCYITTEGSLDGANWVNLDDDGTRAVTVDGAYRYNYGYVTSCPYYRFRVEFSTTGAGQQGNFYMMVGE